VEVSGIQATRALVREAWSEHLDAVSAELVNAPVSIDVMGDMEPPVLGGIALAEHYPRA
jgi:hypothetical protein